MLYGTPLGHIVPFLSLGVALTFCSLVTPTTLTLNKD